MPLYHYTSELHLPSILKVGFIKTVESNASMFQANKEPQVVWLTTDPDPNPSEHGLSGIIYKTAVRFEVDVPEAERWIGSTLYQRTEPWWRDVLVDTAGGLAVAQTWWIAPEPIYRRYWAELRVNGIRRSFKA